MGQPAAKLGDQVMGVDIHIVMVPKPVPTPTPLPSPFTGRILGGVSTDVNIMGKGAAVVGSTAQNVPPHIPAGGPFQKPPTNQGTVKKGSATVKINGKAAARMGDPVQTCNDPQDLPAGIVVVPFSTVMIG